MRRFLVLGLVVAAVLTAAAPARADHANAWWGHVGGDRQYVWEDRSGNERYRGDIAHAVDVWNSAGANITISYRVGPADNRCSVGAYHVVRFCVTPVSDPALAMFLPDPSVGGHLPGGEVDVRADQLGPYGPLHEGGHSLGLAHSSLLSVMNPCFCPNHSSVPSPHDFDALRQVYAHVDPPATATTTRCWLRRCR